MANATVFFLYLLIMFDDPIIIAAVASLITAVASGITGLFARMREKQKLRDEGKLNDK